MPRDALFARTLVDLADTLVDDFDVVELLTLLTDRCVEVLDVSAAGLMLGHPGGGLRVMASSSDAMRLLELFELQSEEGPCPDCYRSGAPIVNHRLAASGGPWPRFGPRAVEAGFRSVHALPMRLRNVTIGALNLFRADEGVLSDADVLAAQALADVATIAVLQHRQARDAEAVNEQLHHALDDRVVIEQAKGMVAERAGLGTDRAFSWLRNHARSHNLRLVDVAHDIIAGDLPAGSLDGGSRSPPPRSAAEARAPRAETRAVLPPLNLAALLRAANTAPPHQVITAVAAELTKIMRAHTVAFLIADYSGQVLVRVDSPEHEQVPIGNSPHGIVLSTQTLTVEPSGTSFRVLVPVTNRGDAIGVLELVLPLAPTESLRQDLRDVAQLLSYVIVSNRASTDAFEWGRRTRPFNLAAEIQHRLLPAASTCEAGLFTLAGWVETAFEAGGDTFDYVLNQDTLWLSLTDAMGHGVLASQLATLLVGALRHQRRGNAPLTTAAAEANTAVLAYSSIDEFVTGIVLTVDLPTGTTTVINAGHPLPLLLRAGTITPIPVPAALPFGMFADTHYPAHEFTLQPADRLLLVSDGITEPTDAAPRVGSGHNVVDLPALVIATATMHPREAAQALCAAATRVSGGGLRDDATVVILDWHPPTVAGERSRRWGL